MFGRDVESDRDLRWPVPRVEAGTPQKRVGQFCDQAELLHDRDEFLGPDVSSCGVVPTRQDLEPDDAIFGQQHQWLIVRLDFPLRDRLSDVLL